ncbi:hypothetical protein KR009_004269 [Drosophila setifemur]|nr:hypothetical protein KR009_004269 [Drosophila setifemur]
MWTKVIFSVVLVAFVGVQFADSLSCHSCYSPTGCRTPATETCSNATANANKAFLESYHNNVPAVNGSLNFQCANLTYYHQANKTHTSEFLGCVHPGTTVCDLTLSNGASWSRKCSTCNTDYCNPAGTFSGSAYTIVGSVIALLLAKVLN